LKINGLSSEVLKTLYEDKNLRKSPSSTRSKEPVADSDERSVSVGIDAELLPTSPEEVAREKVEKIKEAIANGSYVVDVHKISEAMINEILGGDL